MNLNPQCCTSNLISRGITRRCTLVLSPQYTLRSVSPDKEKPGGQLHHRPSAGRAGGGSATQRLDAHRVILGAFAEALKRTRNPDPKARGRHPVESRIFRRAGIKLVIKHVG